MADISEYVKQSSVKTIATLIATFGLIVGSVLTVDTRYAKAEDSKIQEARLGEKITLQTIEIKQQTLDLRRQMLEDKIFELEVKKDSKKLSFVEEALISRYTRQLLETAKELASLTALRRQIEPRNFTPSTASAIESVNK